MSIDIARAGSNMRTSNLEFARLSSATSLYTPPSKSISPIPSTDPTIILICQWMGASPRSRSLNAAYHKYHTLYPSARLLTLRSLPEYFMTTSTASRLAGFEPVISAIDSEPNPRVLVHLFSNGGALTFTDVCTVYRRQTRKMFPMRALILDSAPGQPTAQQGWAAMSIGLPKGLLWYPSAALIWAVLGASVIGKSVFGISGLVYKTAGLLNDGTLVDRRAKRLYVYSEGDQLVGWTDVERHVEEFREGGGGVKVLKEAESPHVQHMILDAERYWMNVQDLWRSTISSE
ncbi:uncharacterized protein RAG0_04783 [Rhynchosporium agropyri]|uniref:Indole-diterpene biosynthesis protein PaxU n=2 Tax=Rhynchosporium TaxID=38037 RepID=A0A1E1KAB9_9HELO|nr:uncharacterized protein RAG0_04783 [Rhynchosporium agropyri]CZS96922.1 uncharacterized protein RCO7_02673 [Rhynchosporium commune]